MHLRMTIFSAIQKNYLYLTKKFFLLQEYRWSLVSLHAKFEEPQATLSRQACSLKTDTHSGKKMAPRQRSQLIPVYG